jgi:hypothetical protein
MPKLKRIATYDCRNRLNRVPFQSVTDMDVGSQIMFLGVLDEVAQSLSCGRILP